jgi:hypothetical protein
MKHLTCALSFLCATAFLVSCRSEVDQQPTNSTFDADRGGPDPRAFSRGKTKPVVIYELFDADEDNIKAQKIRCLSQYNQGLVYFHANEWRTALPLFEKCLQICPDDPISRIYLERCRRRLEHSQGVQ